jgi:hypothetical protein
MLLVNITGDLLAASIVESEPGARSTAAQPPAPRTGCGLSRSSFVVGAALPAIRVRGVSGVATSSLSHDATMPPVLS